ncbi:MAG: redox-regulated ATPase YchF [Candidatus Nezhaarchaeales archaeon]
MGTPLIGIVGKTNVGKTTLFSALTLVPAKIENRQFTTIEPNVGIAYVKAPCVCKELNVADNPKNSLCINGTRYIPVKVMDVAGLIPGAHKGLGLGNKFLDELRTADALIHVVDAAGSTDEEGKPCEPGSRNPLDDVKLIDDEITFWIAGIVKRDWNQVVRRVEVLKENFTEVLTLRLSGLSLKKSHVVQALRKAGVDIKKPSSWVEDDFFSFSRELRRIAKPIIIAANKADVSIAEKNIDLLKAEVKDAIVVPCSAEIELALRRAAEKKLIAYDPGANSFTVISNRLTDEQQRALDRINKFLKRWGGTGVQDLLNIVYFKLLDMIVVYPVSDPIKLTNHEGSVLPDALLVPRGTTVRELARIIHEELSKGFLFAIDARSKRRLNADYVLNDRDVITIVSTYGRR